MEQVCGLRTRKEGNLCRVEEGGKGEREGCTEGVGRKRMDRKVVRDEG